MVSVSYLIRSLEILQAGTWTSFTCSWFTLVPGLLCHYFLPGSFVSRKKCSLPRGRWELPGTWCTILLVRSSLPLFDFGPIIKERILFMMDNYILLNTSHNMNINPQSWFQTSGETPASARRSKSLTTYSQLLQIMYAKLLVIIIIQGNHLFCEPAVKLSNLSAICSPSCNIRTSTYLFHIFPTKPVVGFISLNDSLRACAAASPLPRFWVVRLEKRPPEPELCI